MTTENPSLHRANSPRKGITTAEKNKESNEFPNYMLGSFSKTLSEMKPDPKRQILPGFKMGMSSEIPSYFKSDFSLFYQNSYRNPYIPKLQDINNLILQQKEKDQALKKQEPKEKTEGGSEVLENELNISPNSKKQPYRRKNSHNNLNNQQTVDILSPSNADENFFTKKISRTTTFDIVTHTVKERKNFVLQINEKPLFKDLYSSALTEPNREDTFRHRRELFSEFVEKNDNQHVYAPITHKERPNGPFNQTKNFSIDDEEVKKRKLCRLLTKTSYSWTTDKGSTPRGVSSPVLSVDKMMTPLNSKKSLQSTNKLSEQDYDELIQQRKSQFKFYSEHNKPKPIIIKDQQYRFNHIQLDIPKPKLVPNTDKFFAKEPEFINNFGDQIVRDSINQCIGERFTGRKKTYLSERRQCVSLPDNEEQRNQILFKDLQHQPKQLKLSQGNIFYRNSSFSPSKHKSQN